MNIGSKKLSFRLLNPARLEETKFAIKTLCLFIFTSFVLLSCLSVDRCANFPASLSLATKIGVKLSDVSRTDSLNMAINTIAICYKSSKYAQNDFENRIERISIGTDGKYYIFFSFVGIEDEWLAFKVGQKGAVESAFTYSPLSRFAVPVDR